MVLIGIEWEGLGGNGLECKVSQGNSYTCACECESMCAYVHVCVRAMHWLS